MQFSNEISQMHCSLLEESIAAGLSSAAHGRSNVSLSPHWRQPTQQQEAPQMCDPDTAADAVAALVAAAVMPASSTTAQTDVQTVVNHATSVASGLLSRGFSQLRLAGPTTSTSAAVTTAAGACPVAAALPGVLMGAGVCGSSGSSGKQQQQHSKEEAQAVNGSPQPLVHFSSSLPSDGRMLCTFAGQTQLTALQLCLIASGKVVSGCGAALASLTSLSSLTLSAGQTVMSTAISTSSNVQGPSPLSHAVQAGQRIKGMREISATFDPALQRLALLTHLSLCWIPSSTVVSFPTSLVSIQIQDEIMVPGRGCLQLQHLTRLTHLEVGWVDSRAALPPSLRSLRVHKNINLSVYEDLQAKWEGEPDPRVDLNQLRNLQHLHLSSAPHDSISRLQQLTGLTHLGLWCNVSADRTISDAVSASLPLRWLHVSGFEGHESCFELRRILPQLGSCTQLTYLQLRQLHMTGYVASLSHELQQLPALQELQLVRLTAAEPQGGPAAEHDQGGVTGQGVVGEKSAWGPLFRAIPILAPLRTLVVDRVPLDDSCVDALGGATQLTSLRLAGCGFSEAAAARVRLAFAHLLDGMMRIK
jgi:hypothetical protein